MIPPPARWFTAVPLRSFYCSTNMIPGLFFLIWKKPMCDVLVRPFFAFVFLLFFVPTGNVMAF